MSRYEEHRKARFKQVSDEICKILGSLDKSSLDKVEKELDKLDIDMDYCCDNPDVLCSILKIACGRPYVDIIKSVCG
ncbi:MAG: hypothetical protein KGI11_05470 [Thaumarchaeota archaeon]|nr:hypothetical protein [Nitrososphaerota archaeon]